jgi:hypothetical protein
MPHEPATHVAAAPTNHDPRLAFRSARVLRGTGTRAVAYGDASRLAIMRPVEKRSATRGPTRRRRRARTTRSHLEAQGVREADG